jgi:hypothetical protein
MTMTNVKYISQSIFLAVLATCFHDGFLPKDGGDMFLRNVKNRALTDRGPGEFIGLPH